MPIKWYQKIITENKKEVIKSAVIAIIFTTIFSLWYFKSGHSFEWKNYNFIAEPTLTWRLLSALVFTSLGWILYQLKFYYILYLIFVIFLRDKYLYNDVKKLIWHGLMFIMGFFILPWIINAMNTVLSFFYNLLLLILYITPSLCLFLLSLLILIKVFKKFGSKLKAKDY